MAELPLLGRGTALEQDTIWPSAVHGWADSSPGSAFALSFRMGGAVQENTSHGPVPEQLCPWPDGASRPGLWCPQLETPSDHRHRTSLPARLLLLVGRPLPVIGHPLLGVLWRGLGHRRGSPRSLGGRLIVHWNSGWLHWAQDPSYQSHVWLTGFCQNLLGGSSPKEG